MNPPVICQLTGASASLPIQRKAQCLGQQGGGGVVGGCGGGGAVDPGVTPGRGGVRGSAGQFAGQSQGIACSAVLACLQLRHGRLFAGVLHCIAVQKGPYLVSQSSRCRPRCTPTVVGRASRSPCSFIACMRLAPGWTVCWHGTRLAKTIRTSGLDH